MKMESGLKHFSPQGMLINDDTKSTSPDRLNGTDIMYAFGATSSRARFGLAAFLGKAGVSRSDEQLAVQALARYAMEAAPKNVRKAAGGQFGNCMMLLAQFAFAEYSRSAASTATCLRCNGTGKPPRRRSRVKYPTHGESALLGQSLPRCSSVRLGAMDRGNGDCPGQM
jgi:hypothetical protein